VTPYYETARAKVYHGEALETLRGMASESIDAVICDPPYAEVSRSYGRWTEEEWFALMKPVVREVRRVLKPKGSAMFVVQPNSERVGKMRTWVWDFLAWAAREWNVVQDAYWWNTSSPPTVHCHRDKGLMRPSTKPLAWIGDSDCYRNQDAVLWDISDSMKAANLEQRALKYMPSGFTFREGRIAATCLERGGSTPFNVLPISNGGVPGCAGTHGHGAGTPLALCSWWVRYICPPGGTVLDPFNGTATVGVAALKLGRSYVGIERIEEYCAISAERLRAAESVPQEVTR
jgi:DNA modification methylase